MYVYRYQRCGVRHIALDDALQEPEGRQGRPGLDRLHPVEQEGEEEQVHDDADAPFIRLPDALVFLEEQRAGDHEEQRHGNLAGDGEEQVEPVQERARVVRQEAVEPALVRVVEDDQQNGKNAQGIEA